MGERRKDQLAGFRRWLVTFCVVSWFICLVFGGLPSASDQVIVRHLAWRLTRLFLFVALTLGICYYSQRHAAASARSQGRPFREIAESELSAGVGPGLFLPIYGLVAVDSFGWAWAAIFFGISGLYVLHLLLRWRRYMRLPAEAG